MKSLQQSIAALESKLDFYETEFDYLNSLLKTCGFPKGIETLKESAHELLEDEFLEKKLANHKK
jgi:hypothetical protein